MASTGAQRTHVRLAATLLASLLVAFAVLTYLSYTAAFSSFDTVTLTAPRAGLVMDRGGKVKYRGIQIGKVDNISYSEDKAQLTLAIDSGELRYIPANAAVHIASNTIFGAKSVEFIPPKSPSATAAAPGRALGRLGGIAGSQHFVSVAHRPAAQDRPGRAERDAERAGRRSARTRQ